MLRNFVISFTAAALGSKMRGSWSSPSGSSKVIFGLAFLCHCANESLDKSLEPIVGLPFEGA